MANVFTTNPIFLDTFSSDIDVTRQVGGPLRIKAIVFHGGSANDKFVSEDNAGNWNVELQAPTAGESKVLSFGGNVWIPQILIVDVSDGTYNSGARCYIYV